jgi:hypothetical protein
MSFTQTAQPYEVYTALLCGSLRRVVWWLEADVSEAAPHFNPEDGGSTASGTLVY